MALWTVQTRHKMRRQALATTPKELRQIADKLERETIETFASLKIYKKNKRVEDIKHQINIINPYKTSDTWRFE